MRENPLRSQERAIERLLSELPSGVVGARLQRARSAQNLSVRDLAESAGLSKNSIVRLEKGEEVRAITILKVCTALGLHVERLAEPDVEESVAIHRPTDDRWFDLGDFGGGVLGGLERPLTPEERAEFARNGVPIPLLMLKSRLPQGKILPTILELHQESIPRSHPGEEFIYVLEGIARITVGESSYTLSRGESMDFWASEPHSYANAGDSPAWVLSIRVNP